MRKGVRIRVVMVFVIILLSVALLVLVFRPGKKRTLPTRTAQQQDDELISVILPTINNDK